jgi:hypothetical protein
MKEFVLVISIFLLKTTLFSQSQHLKEQIRSLSTICWRGQFEDNPSNETVDQLNTINSEELARAKEIVGEMIKSDNKILSHSFLLRPDSATLHYFFIVRALMWNKKATPRFDKFYLVDSLNAFPAGQRAQLASYYNLLFGSTVNKNETQNVSEVNLDLDSYGLKDSTEKGIFFLESMSIFSQRAWGYMTIPKQPDYEAALAAINNVPKYNGQPYYKFKKLYFPDFYVVIDKKTGMESFRKHYLNQYLNTLLDHSTALGQNKKSKAEQSDLVFGSILSDESYYKYSKNPEKLARVVQDVIKR